MAFVVVVVGAVDVRVEDQLPGQIVGHGGVCIAGKAAEQLDAGLHQSHLRPGADAAAEHDVCAMLYEKALGVCPDGAERGDGALPVAGV